MIRAALLALALSVAATSATAACRQALALGLDVSGSVDAKEYRAQLDGLASALNDPEVRAKVLQMPSAPVRLLVYEWSGPADQHVLLPWSVLDQPAALDIAIETLRQTRRRNATPGTALGVAMTFGAQLLAQQPDCWKRTLDISGDGKSNLGPRPRDVNDRIERSGITINGLVIGADAPNMGDLRQAEISELSAYYSAEVVLGPDAFVQTALGYDQYTDAMKRKLLRELDGLVLSYLPPQPDR
jgi:Protein of unknown function (DUF1194)